MENQISNLKKKSVQVRNQILEMIFSAQKGHIGGSLSCVDILVALFYGGIIQFDSRNPNWEKRDRFILSKGHAIAALYAILADLGFFSMIELLKYQQKNSILLGHPHRKVFGIEADTGSLGHGLGIAAGLALSAKLNKEKFKTFVLLGDGECHEGSVWEAALFAAHHKLNSLIAIIDKNDLCSTDSIKNCLDLESLSKKWAAFNWDVVKINGHSFQQLISSFKKLNNERKKPLMIIAQTVKGKGVSFMENSPDWHHKVPNEQEFKLAKEELK
jgi:transketolase